MMAAGIEKVKSAVYIGGEVELGRLNGRSYAGAGGEVNDGIEAAFGEGAFDEDGITNVAFDDGDLVLEAGDVQPLDAGVIVVVEIINDGDLVFLCEERFDEV